MNAERGTTEQVNRYRLTRHAPEITLDSPRLDLRITWLALRQGPVGTLPYSGPAPRPILERSTVRKMIVTR